MKIQFIKFILIYAIVGQLYLNALGLEEYRASLKIDNKINT